MREFLNTLILLGAIQGIITSILLFWIKPGRLANKLLAWFTLLVALACLNLYFFETVSNPGPVWQVLAAVTPLIIIMPLGPLAYFYVKALLNPGLKLGKPTRRHFYSAIFDLFPYLVATLLLLGSYFGLISSQKQSNWQLFIENYDVYVDIPRWLSLSIYLWFTHRLVQKHRATQPEHPVIRWAQSFTLSLSLFAIIWLMHLVPYMIPSLSDGLLASVGWYPVYTPLIILIYWVGISGFLISLKSYKNTPKPRQIPPATIDQTIAALKRAMEVDKLYLNPSLKLNDLVTHLNTPQKTVSLVLNQYLNSSFNDFVNAYRIEAIKARLIKESSDHLTITGVALECGFNAQATFQRAFKKAEGLSPKEYLKSQTKKQ